MTVMNNKEEPFRGLYFMSKPVTLPDGTKCWSGPNCKKHGSHRRSSYSNLFPKTALEGSSVEDLLTTKCLQYAVLLADQWGSRKVVVTYIPQEDGTKYPVHMYGLKDKTTVGDVHGEQPFPHNTDFLKTEILDSQKAVSTYGGYFN